ncbi:peptide/nickel transport system ATP-binding protein [Caldalkalibacillus uzonensis]|uniref:Peptide/nickel transport system ATP-binding protein n=1 Tax=Caldalkalibacillus uzonensis TaxID=353224 RepID=A0ABU0CWT1_9BACI|nr:ABC transporter ATP-binding protein [Caldalkalibacillus uzonensis]MDQ0340602.1 peptide/nickel transport system ATP-binding protein [Caldalkalibacillus uzonensis]
MSALLEVRNLKTYFYNRKKELPIIDGIDFDVNRGETVALVGESGSGKSMTAFSIMRLLPSPGGKIVEGQILFEGQDLVQLSEEDMFKVRGNDIAMIFQEPMTSLNPVLTIGEQITEVLRYHKKMEKKAARERAVELLKLVGFGRAEQILGDYPHRLSGGMRQRVMIAMAMSCDPKLLIADEPTTALDVTIQAQILELMKKVSEEFDSSIILITHDLGVVAELAERVIVMYAGQIQEEAPVKALFNNPLHPYTFGLLASMPSIEGGSKRLYSIPGNVPSPENFPTGCRFAPRCAKAIEACYKTQPELREIEPGHKVRCHLC